MAPIQAVFNIMKRTCCKCSRPCFVSLTERARRNLCSSSKFQFTDLFQLRDETRYRKLPFEEPLLSHSLMGVDYLSVPPAALTLLAQTAFHDVSHYLRPSHLKLVSSILDDKEASQNDHFVAVEMLKNAVIAADGILPMCQDTGTAIISAKRGHCILTDGMDEQYLAQGIYNAYTGNNFRYSQMAPLSMFEEVNTKTNLPAQIEIGLDQGSEYNFLFVAKGGGSANKTYLFQETKALLNKNKLLDYLTEKASTLGTAACPPYHLVFVIGGLSAEMTLKTVKMASTKYLDTLPTTGDSFGRAFRDLDLEAQLLKRTQDLGIGAQFGGKYFTLDVRIVRLPRHGASLPVGLGVSCQADRQVKGKITREGLFLEELERDPAQYLPAPETITDAALEKEMHFVHVDLSQPMDKIRELLSQYPPETPLKLTGTIVVARDIAHAKIKEKLEKGEDLPDYFKNHVIYYAGPAKTPDGKATGSFGPTTAGRMDSYVDDFMQHGGSYITLAKGNRSSAVTKACKKYGGFYLGSIGGGAALLAEECIKRVDCLDFPELGMEAVWKIDVKDFPAFIIVDDKGHNFFDKWLK